LNQAIEDYEEKITEMNNNHDDAYNSLEEEKVQSEMSL
jgi:outer membrane protein TolC